MAARKVFLSRVSEWPLLRGMILFGVSPFILNAIRIALRLKLIPFPVVTVKSYQEAIEAATSILQNMPSSEQSVSLAPSVHTDKRWKLDLGGYSIRFEVVNGTVLHSVQQGRVMEEHLDPVFELRDEVMRSSGLKGKRFSILAGLDEDEGSDDAGRLGYVRRMARWYKENPFDIEVFYGLNPLMRTVINVSARLAPFKVHVSKNYEDGMAYISDFVSGPVDGKLNSVSPPQTTSGASDGIPQERIDELLKVLGAISCDTDEDLNLHRIDPSDPLALVYGAIGLVKTEIDDLLARQERDATERRHLQERLARSEKMEALGLLAGGVAHDLNNILSGIVSYPELLLMDETLSSETRLTIETIKTSGDQAAAVVKDLMAISRGVATKMEPVSLSVIARDYLQSAEFVALSTRSENVEILTRFDAGSAMLSGSAVNLRKVVANLVANAIESIGPSTKGGRVELGTSTRRVDAERTVGTDRIPVGDYVVLRVEDNGSGIDPEHRDRLFEPFFSKKIMGREGTGLGLTVVWNIVHSHQGFIDLVSDDQGTWFDVYFPTTSDTPPKAVERVSLAHVRGTGQRVLVVDDVAVQREVAVAFLVQLGYRAESVSSGETAVERLQQETFDILLLDMWMEPGINGRETFQKILEFRPDQKVVIASGYSQDEEVRRVMALGAGAFIAKPYSLEELGLALRDVLTGSSAF